MITLSRKFRRWLWRWSLPRATGRIAELQHALAHARHDHKATAWIYAAMKRERHEQMKRQVGRV